MVETDLGEFIIQLAGETPSHIIAPAIHHDRDTVADAVRGATAATAVEADIGAEAAYARVRLRESFLSADVGIRGVNFAVAETGSICLVENEGNGRMCTRCPASTSPSWAWSGSSRDWDELRRVAHAAGPLGHRPAAVRLHEHHHRTPPAGEVDGPEEFHLVMLDNGRSAHPGHRVPRGPALHPLRRLPERVPGLPPGRRPRVRRVYSGPIGAVLTPLLHPDDPAARELAEASTLCGACWEVCPVRIPLHDLLLPLRRRDAGSDAGRVRRLGFRGWSWLWRTRAGFAALDALGRLGRRLARRPDAAARLAGAWAEGRELP